MLGLLNAERKSPDSPDVPRPPGQGKLDVDSSTSQRVDRAPYTPSLDGASTPL